MWVRSMLSKGNFLWSVILKSYSLCCLGRFIHAILQPILSTLKGGRSHNSGVNSSEIRFGFQISPFPLSLCYQHLGIIIFDFWFDSRAPDISGGKPAKTSESCGSPPTKRHKQEERDLGFLLVKNKDGQDCLFVDLGKRNTEMIRFSLPVFTASYLQKQEFTPRTEISGCTSHRRLGRGPCSPWQRTTRFTPNPRKVGLQRKACFWLP